MNPIKNQAVLYLENFDEFIEGEEWRPIAGYEGLCEVSSLGRVRSWRHPRGKRPKPRILKQSLARGGYARVNLYYPRHGLLVHRLVVEAFVGPIPEGFHVCHNDGIRLHNSVLNLRIDTPLGNNLDQDKHGTRLRGAAHPSSVVTEAQAKRIIFLTGKLPQKEIASMFSTTRQTVNNIQNGFTWSHLDRSAAGTYQKLIEHEGRSQTVSAWAAEIGLKAHTLAARLRRGMSVAQALTKPLKN
jgi:hypothetical protein